MAMKDADKVCEICDTPMRVDKGGTVYCNCPGFRVETPKIYTEKLPSDQLKI